MTRGIITRDSDGETVDLDKQEAEHAEIDAQAKRVILVDSSGSIIKLTRSRENLLGSAGTGTDGETNRVYTLTIENKVDIIEVFSDGVLLIETSQYTIDNDNKQVTLLLNTWDTQVISIFYNV